MIWSGFDFPEDSPLDLLINIHHFLLVLVSIDDEDRSGEGKFFIHQPALVQIVELLQILQGNLVLLTAGSYVDSFQYLC